MWHIRVCKTQHDIFDIAVDDERGFQNESLSPINYRKISIKISFLFEAFSEAPSWSVIFAVLNSCKLIFSLKLENLHFRCGSSLYFQVWQIKLLAIKLKLYTTVIFWCFSPGKARKIRIRRPMILINPDPEKTRL